MPDAMLRLLSITWASTALRPSRPLVLAAAEGARKRSKSPRNRLAHSSASIDVKTVGSVVSPSVPSSPRDLISTWRVTGRSYSGASAKHGGMDSDTLFPRRTILILHCQILGPGRGLGSDQEHHAMVTKSVRLAKRDLRGDMQESGKS